MLTVAISASVVLFIGILALKCVSAAQDVVWRTKNSRNGFCS